MRQHILSVQESRLPCNISSCLSCWLSCQCNLAWPKNPAFDPLCCPCSMDAIGGVPSARFFPPSFASPALQVTSCHSVLKADGLAGDLESHSLLSNMEPTGTLWHPTKRYPTWLEQRCLSCNPRNHRTPENMGPATSRNCQCLTASVEPLLI